MSEAAADQGHVPYDPSTKPKRKPDWELPSDAECEAGLEGIRATRAAITKAHVARLTGKDD